MEQTKPLRPLIILYTLIAIWFFAMAIESLGLIKW
jgi:hypothetical protein